MTSIKGRNLWRKMDERDWERTIGDRPFIASDKWMQKDGHCIVFYSQCTSAFYNSIYYHNLYDFISECTKENIDIKLL